MRSIYFVTAVNSSRNIFKSMLKILMPIRLTFYVVTTSQVRYSELREVMVNYGVYSKLWNNKYAPYDAIYIVKNYRPL